MRVLKTISMMVLAAGVSFAALQPAFAQDAAEMLLRLDKLESENRRLNGQIEQVQFQNRKLEDQLKRMQSDVDFRLKEVEAGKGGGGGAAARTAPAVTPLAGATPSGGGKKGDAFDPNANPHASGVPKALGATPSRGVNAGQNPIDTLGAGGDAPKHASVAAGGGAKSEFDTAKLLLDQGNFEQAETEFKLFLRNHGKDKLAPDAMFNLGESFYRRNRYRESAEQYLNLTSQYGKSVRAPEATLKLGMSMRNLGAKEEACGTYAEIAKKYPNASAAIKAAAEREKQRAGC